MLFLGVIDTVNKLISIGRDAAENTANAFTGLTGENTDIHFTGLRFVPVEFVITSYSIHYTKLYEG